MTAPHELRVLRTALLGGLPAVVATVIIAFAEGYSAKVQWTLAIVTVGAWLVAAFALREQVVRPLNVLSNLLAALRTGDYTIRARGASHGDALGLALVEVNALGTTLREQRLGAIEATNLLRTVIAEIDVAVFAFDEEGRLRLVNRAGERLLGAPSERLLGTPAAGSALEPCLMGEAPRTLEASFSGAMGRWEVRRQSFRLGGRPHTLLVLSDLRRALREEERLAWQRLVRVLGHEINNSLAPIRSIAGSLERILDREPRAEDWETDLRGGLGIVASRAEALQRFMTSYARLARLPPPRFGEVDVGAWIRRNVALVEGAPVTFEPGPELVLSADGDQLDQALINLLKNAADAARETGGGVGVSWRRLGADVEVLIDDDGPGISETANLFVPFFTTKPGGSGIGLVLSRQIAEQHGGTLALENRAGIRGCRARLTLPMSGRLARPGRSSEGPLE